MAASDRLQGWHDRKVVNMRIELSKFVIYCGGCVVLGGLLLCAGCLSATSHGAANGDSNQALEGRARRIRAQLRPGLIVNIQVLVAGQKEIEEKSRRISEAGAVTLPLVGEIRLEGLTVTEAQEQLKTAYGRYFVTPQVIVECLVESVAGAVSPWGYVTVLGRVRTPGMVNLPPTRELTVSRAVQLSGGLDNSARSNAIRVTRTQGNSTEQFEVDLDRIGASGQVKDDVLLLPGDVIYVPEAIF